MFDLGLLADAETMLDELLASLEPGTLLGSEAAECLAVAVRVRNKSAAVEGLLARRVADTPAWRAGGARSPAHYLAKVRGSSVSDAAATVEAVAMLDELPAVTEAFKAGKLSGPQLVPVATVAADRPGSEQALLAAAESETVTGLRRRCVAVADTGVDAQARHDRVHAARSLTHRPRIEGGFEMSLRGTNDDLAAILAAIGPHQRAAFDEARRAGRHERADAYAYDGFLRLCEASSSTGGPGPIGDAGPGTGQPGQHRRSTGSDTKIIMRVDHAAWVRGHAVEGEVCDIAGVGPVPMSVVDAAMGDAFLAAVVTKGHDVVNVAHLGRKPTAHQRTALQFTAPECTAEGCHQTALLEIDHEIDWQHTGHTLLGELEVHCRHHHRLKTVDGWRLVAGTGKRPMVPPGHPDHPGPPGRPAGAARLGPQRTAPARASVPT